LVTVVGIKLDLYILSVLVCCMSDVNLDHKICLYTED